MIAAILVVVLGFLIGAYVAVLVYSKENRGLNGAMLVVNIHSMLGIAGIHI